MDSQAAHRTVATSMVIIVVTIALAQGWLLLLRDFIISHTHSG